jgi:hypothetical protein
LEIYVSKVKSFGSKVWLTSISDVALAGGPSTVAQKTEDSIYDVVRIVQLEERIDTSDLFVVRVLLRHLSLHNDSLEGDWPGGNRAKQQRDTAGVEYLMLHSRRFRISNPKSVLGT